MLQYKYRTEKEFAHFNFTEAVVGDIGMPEGIFHMVLDNVQILPENSCNRDIRTMRTNELLFTIEEPEGLSVVEEGFKTYDADGKLTNVCEDRQLAREDYAQAVENIVGGNVYSMEQQIRKERMNTALSWMEQMTGPTQSRFWERRIMKNGTGSLPPGSLFNRWPWEKFIEWMAVLLPGR